MNTLEWLPIFLPSLWLFAIYVSDAIAAVIGLVWIVGRIVYLIGYTKSVRKRGPGFAHPGDRRRSCSGSARPARLSGGSCMDKDVIPASEADPSRRHSVKANGRTSGLQAFRRWLLRSPACMTAARHFVSGQPLSLAVKNALSPGTTASCL